MSALLMETLAKKEIKQRTHAATPEEQKWMLDAMPLYMILTNVVERMEIYEQDERDFLDLAKEIIQRKAEMKGADYGISRFRTGSVHLLDSGSANE